LRRLLGQNDHLEVGSNPRSGEDSLEHVFRPIHDLNEEGHLTMGAVDGCGQGAEGNLEGSFNMFSIFRFLNLQ